jgi:hypothetical protein
MTDFPGIIMTTTAAKLKKKEHLTDKSEARHEPLQQIKLYI